MTGIRDWIPEAREYRPLLTQEQLDDFCKALDKVSKPYNPYTLLMGLDTMLSWRFAEELLISNIYLKYYISSFKRSKIVYYSLLEKHGPYKLIITTDRFKYKLYKGTVKIGDYDNVISLVDRLKKEDEAKKVLPN
jgi:hypothetical protein